ncbi:cytochrome P450 [Embleya sp. NPDC050493]|uniref:cytochrome P450 n=1 Tax=Embleya sp. NPDC050493 TaxID=3363989 RepID=UPI0037B86023
MQSSAPTTVIDSRSVVALLSRLRSVAGQADPLPLYASLREMGEVVPAPWGGFLVTGHRACDEVLRSPDWLALDRAWRARQTEGSRWSTPSSRELEQTLVALNPPEHTRIRRSVNNIFDRGTLEALRPTVQRVANTLLDTLIEQAGDADADFAELVGEQLPVATVGHWLGLPPEDFDLLRALTHAQAYAQELLPTKRQLLAADDAIRGLREYFTTLIARRRADPGDDVISGWLRAWDALEPDRELADENVYSLAMFVVIASLETTSTLLSTMIWTFDRHPAQRAWLRAHPAALADAVEEVFRYDPPIHVTTRHAGRDLILAGVPIARGEVVHTMLGAANHDPALTPDAGTFDVSRRARHISFGGGIHYCIGAGLARLEAGVLLETVLRRLPALRVVAPPTWEPRLAFRRITLMPVSVR